MKTVIIAEKPSVAANIAGVVQASKKDGYFEGEKYIVTYAFGHLMRLYDAKEYNEEWGKWDVGKLPVIPEVMKYKLIDDKGVNKQFKIIKDLFSRSDVDLIINACDADREGSLIFSEIYKETGCTKPVKHLWVSSHTPKDVLNGLKNLRDDDSMKPLQMAGYCRQWADWLYGINFTVATTKLYSTDKKTVLNVGRVILPTVYMIYKRDMEIKNFKPVPFYKLRVSFQAEAGEYEGYFLKDNKTQFGSKDSLAAVETAIKGKKGIVHDVITKEIFKGAPRLFNLSDLQGHMTAKYKGFTADKVLKIAQNLYERRFLTYPRTESRYLDDSQTAQARESLDAVSGFFPELPIRFVENNNIFNSKKVESHPAITPTYIVPKEGELTPDENLVYMKVVKRFVAQFLTVAKYEQTEILTEIASHLFVTKGSVLIDAGWLAVNGQAPNDEVEEDGTRAVKVRPKEVVSFVRSELIEDQTKPPKHYTVQTLLKAMETCGKEDVEDVLPGYTVGTAATRAEIIKKIQQVGYVKSIGKTLQITDMGISLVDLFPLKDMLEPSFTGRIERSLKEIELGQYQAAQFMNVVKAKVTKGILQMKDIRGEIKTTAPASLGSCPECGRAVVETLKSFSCSGCKFSVWKEDRWFGAMKKKVTASMMKSFLVGKPVMVKGFVSKNGKKFDARVKLVKQENGYWGFKFDN